MNKDKDVAVVAPAQEKSVFDGFDTRDIVFTLRDLMKEVTSKDVTSETVHAACNCADKINDLLRIHLDAERLRRRTKGL